MITKKKEEEEKKNWKVFTIPLFYKIIENFY